MKKNQQHNSNQTNNIYYFNWYQDNELRRDNIKVPWNTELGNYILIFLYNYKIKRLWIWVINVKLYAFGDLIKMAMKDTECHERINI